jgi:diguanylate cyclase (GGDEF)-like protein/PAS domain S-box-containing protein
VETTETHTLATLRSGATILVVDDNRAKRLAINTVLAPLGHAIVEVDSGEAALRAVMTQTFAVILMDVQMPVMDGYATAKLIRMREQCEDTPIIFITAHSNDEARTGDAYESGAVDFMFAPLVPHILRAKVGIFVDLFLKSRDLERSLSDITSLSRRFRDSEARVSAVLANVAEGIITINDAGVIESFNSAATDLFGYTESEAIGRRFSLMVAPQYPEDFADCERAAEKILIWPQKNGRSPDSLGRRQDGSTFAMELDLTDVQLGAGTINIACVRDISERQIYTEALQHQAVHDSLTGLPNRVLFSDRVNHALAAAARLGEPMALLVLDLNEFKSVNDTYGHDHGDELLKLITERLVGCLRDGDTVARLGGDEFGVLPLAPTDVGGAATVAWKIQQALDEPLDVNGDSIEVNSSIGISLFPDHGDNIDDLLRRADLAMYDAKRSGAGYAVFAAEQEEAPARRLSLLTDLRHAIDRDEFVLHYQPKIDLTSRRTIGVEALIRWTHPSGQLFMPGEFMPAIEDNELLIPITDWVIHEALSSLHAWRADGYDLTMAINLEARCLSERTGLFETIERTRNACHIPAEKLTFELTERAIIDANVPGLLGRLEKMGERLSVDDFGTGYSSLTYLRRLPVVEIKADKSFVTSLADVKEDAVIVRAMIDLAHNLDLTVVAEGVEDERTMNLLIEYGCDEAQGYHFTRPLPGEQLLPWLKTSRFGATCELVPARAEMLA